MDHFPFFLLSKQSNKHQKYLKEIEERDKKILTSKEVENSGEHKKSDKEVGCMSDSDRIEMISIKQRQEASIRICDMFGPRIKFLVTGGGPTAGEVRTYFFDYMIIFCYGRIFMMMIM